MATFRCPGPSLYTLCMNGRHAICLVIDGLRAGALGCYGNTVSRTPHFDDLASRSAIVEWLWADAPSKEEFYQSVWQGRHSARPAEQLQQLSPLHATLQAHEVPLRLITDDAWLVDWLPDESCQSIARHETEATTAAENVGQTAFAKFCSVVVEHLEEWIDDGTGSVTWIHSKGLLAAWDAPLVLRSELLDEEDPETLEILDPPRDIQVDDPDQLLLYRSAYAAQVSAMDACFGALCESIGEIMSDRETLLMVAGSQGFPLGEHGTVGSDCKHLFSERLHLPWLLHICDHDLPLPRISGLAQPTDIPATLLDWLGIETPGRCDGFSVLPSLEESSGNLRDIALTVGEAGEHAIRTSDWFMQSSTSRSPQLFAKPDDRWEHNDVAVRCPEEVEQLSEITGRLLQCADYGKPLPTAHEHVDSNEA